MTKLKHYAGTILLPGAVLQVLLANAAQGADAAGSAAEAPSQGLEEIVVTAARREESQSKVPISVTAFTQETMDRDNVRTIDDIVRLTPGVQFNRTTEASSAIANISIRGIQSDAGSGATGIYIDDTPIQSRASFRGLGSSVWPQVFDLARVEVLRGPQGTLFGAGSEGGTVRFITPQPSTTKVQVYARADQSFTEGGQPSTEGGAAVNLPLVDGVLGVRLSASYRHDGGYINRIDYLSGNVQQKGTNYDDVSTFRIAALYKATDSLTITPSFYWQNGYYNDSNAYWASYSNPGNGDFNRSSNIRNQATDKFSLPALKVEWGMGDVQLTGNVSYFQRAQPSVDDLAYFESAVWAGQPYYPAGMYAPSFQHTVQRNFTQEVRLQSVDPTDRVVWTVGVFHTDNYQNSGQMVQDTFLPNLIQQNLHKSFESMFGAPLLDGLYTVVVGPFITVDKQLAGFGQADIKLTSKLIGTVGLRVAKVDSDTDVSYSGPIIGPTVHNTNSTSSTPVTPKFGLSYQVSDGEMLYTSVSKGYRIGGANNPVAAACGVSTTGQPVPGTDLGNVGLTSSPKLFKNDSLWSYEIGSKMRALNGRLAVDASAYLIKWKDIQFSYTLPMCGFSLTTNAGNATSKGFELTVQSRPLDYLDLGVALGYVHAAYDNTSYFNGLQVPGGAITGSGDRLAVSPWTVSVVGQLNFPVLDHDAYFRVDYSYADSMNQSLPNQDPRTGGYDPDIPGLPVLNDLTLKLGAHFGATDVAVYANNVANQHPVLAATHAIAHDPLFLDTTVRPRTLGITAAYRF